MRDWAHVARRYPASLLDRRPTGAWASGTRSPVVLLPGIYERTRYLRPLALHLHAAGHPVHVVPGLGFNRSDLDRSAHIVADRLRELDLRDTVLVAHSKGGLIGKTLMLDADAAARVRGMVAVCTPFSGSPLAWRVFTRTPLGLFSPTSPVLVALLAESTVNARISSIASAWDEMIPGGSHLVGARNITLDMPGHFRPIADAGVHEIIAREVARFEEDR